MDIKYLIFDNLPDEKFMDDIEKLYRHIFGGSSDDLITKFKDKNNLVFNIALVREEVVGFKIGYELDQNKFYSWLGGVTPDYREHGIASKLMEQQHQHLREIGYKVVQTKTMNKWRGMLLLNIKYGFDIVDTYTDENGLHKIILEKQLQD